MKFNTASKLITSFWSFGSLGLIVTAALTGCAAATSTNTATTEDSSASGTIASAVGGALSATSASGTQASLLGFPKKPRHNSIYDIFDILPEALASSSSSSTTCPTYKTAAGSTCATSSGTMWLTYSSCSFSGSAATWSGVQAITLSGTSPVVTCGTFPHPLASNTLTRQYVTASSGTTPSSTATVTTASGAVTTIDDATSNLGNFDTGTTIAANVGSGYGSIVGFTSGLRTSINLAHHVSAVNAAGTNLYDHSFYTGSSGTTTALTVAETSGATTRTVNGTVTLYHNLLKVVGTATLTNVVHSDSCCFPTGGTIKTTFAAGTNVKPTTTGLTYVGQSETLSITGCGTATLTDVTGTSSSVTLTRCL